MRTRRRSVLVTGASGGIGAAVAAAFLRQGDNVAAHYLSADIEALLPDWRAAAAGGGRVAALAADLTRPEAAGALTAEAEALFGPVDVLVNNAGVAWQGLLTEMSAAEWDYLFALNARAPFLCAKAVIPAMTRRGQGQIINISSVWGLTGASCEAAYAASKGAVIALTKSLAKELGPAGVRVNCVAPGVIDTKMNSALDAAARTSLREATPLGVLGRPEDVAAAVIFLASPAAAFITGQVLSPNGGFVI
ncbi:MAG: 3-oxoacyl-ACP reductase FabG [Gracilibacteraceae bacterium]|nr:3-oxoacyl-ACP reductase FabG [Gracilibacteraceae bacterium]